MNDAQTGTDIDAHLLIVDDDERIRVLLQKFLMRSGFLVSAARDAAHARRLLSGLDFDLIVLDVMMPGEDGISVCRRLSAQGSAPILMLTAMGEETDRIIGLEVGADDYLPKPFNPRELLARIKAILRRAGRAVTTAGTLTSHQVHFAGWTLDTDKQELHHEDGREAHLTTSEFKLLTVFLERPRFVLSRDQLLDLTSGRSAHVFDRTIDNQVSRLRKKIETDLSRPEIITTVRGGGYSLATDVRIER